MARRIHQRRFADGLPGAEQDLRPGAVADADPEMSFGDHKEILARIALLEDELPILELVEVRQFGDDLQAVVVDSVKQLAASEYINRRFHPDYLTSPSVNSGGFRILPWIGSCDPTSPRDLRHRFSQVEGLLVVGGRRFHIQNSRCRTEIRLVHA